MLSVLKRFLNDVFKHFVAFSGHWALVDDEIIGSEGDTIDWDL